MPPKSGRISLRFSQLPLFWPGSLAVAAVVSCLALAACGGSSSSSSGSSSAGESSASGSAKVTGAAHLASLRACLGKHGIPILARDSVAGAEHGKSEGVIRPKGVTEARYRAALSTCGVTVPRGSGVDTGDATLASFARCMRATGVDLPNPNTSGRGALFDTKGLDVDGSKFKSAASHCRGELKRAASGDPAKAGSSGP